jgi:AraC-like DNA-binding protein
MDWLNVRLLFIIAITGIAQGFFLSSALLTTKRGERIINRLNVCLVALFTLDILFYIIFYTSYIKINYCIRLLYGPVLLIYLNVYSTHSFQIKKKNILHLLPFFISLLFLLALAVLSLGPGRERIAYSAGLNSHALWNTINHLFSLSTLVYMSTYLILCYKKLKEQGMKRSWFNKKNFNIYSMLIVIFLFYVIICFITSVIRSTGTEITLLLSLPVIFITLVLYFIGYMGMLKPEFLFITWDKGNNHSVYKKIHLTEQKSREYLRRLLSVMEKEKLYTDPDLTLPVLAERVTISRNLLSYLLNSVLGINFYDFVNGFRIEAVKALLTDSTLENESILTIAFHAGFNSKSAFNKIFKKHTNMSPSEYKKISLKKTKETKIFSHILELNLLESMENGYGIKSVCSGTS